VNYHWRLFWWYAKSVRDGFIVAGELVRLAVDRFFYDLKRPELKFEPGLAIDAIEFFAFLPHVKGELAKPPAKTIDLEPWQCFLIGSLFGWTWRETGKRRFRIAYIEVARKNGKSTLAAGIAGYLLAMDEEWGAEVYSSATTRDQAKIVFSILRQMVKRSPDLAEMVDVYKHALVVEDTFSNFQPLSSDHNTLDGLNTHGSICDELHAWPTRDLWDVIEESTASREQPLQVAITTAGADRETICYELRDYGEKILRGFRKGFDDDTFFAMIYTIDKGDKWEDDLEIRRPEESRVWIKANPNLGVSCKLEYLARKARKVKGMPSAQANFERKHLNMWVQSESRWLDMEIYDQNKTSGLYVMKDGIVDLDATLERFAGRFAVMGIDLSAVSDMTCLIYMLPDPEDRMKVSIIMRAWAPKAWADSRKNKYRRQYDGWRRSGWVKITDGDAIDYDVVRNQIEADSDILDLKLIGMDKQFQGIEFSQKLGDKLGHTEKSPVVIGLTNHYQMVGPVVNEFERRLISKMFDHGGNPVLRWMFDNVALAESPDGWRKPIKSGSQGKIDGVMGCVYALGRLMASKPKKKKVMMPVFVEVKK